MKSVTGLPARVHTPAPKPLIRVPRAPNSPHQQSFLKRHYVSDNKVPPTPAFAIAISARCIQAAISLNQVLQAHGRSFQLIGAKCDQLQRRLRLHRQTARLNPPGGTGRKRGGVGGGEEGGKKDDRRINLLSFGCRNESQRGSAAAADARKSPES